MANVLEVDNYQFLGKKLFDEIMTLNDSFPESDLKEAYDYLLQNILLAIGFMDKTHSFMCIWMDKFLI